MNHFYRNVWDAISGTVVAVAEVARGRRHRGSSGPSGGTGTDAPSGRVVPPASSFMQAVLSLEAGKKRHRRLTTATPRPMLLEQRLMFDGAAAVDAIDAGSRLQDPSSMPRGPDALRAV